MIHESGTILSSRQREASRAKEGKTLHRQREQEQGSRTRQQAGEEFRFTLLRGGSGRPNKLIRRLLVEWLNILFLRELNL